LQRFPAQRAAARAPDGVVPRDHCEGTSTGVQASLQLLPALFAHAALERVSGRAAANRK
jgi:hypothetical protein